MKLVQFFGSIFLVSFSIFSFISCNDDEISESNNNYVLVDSVTDLYLYDENGAAIGKWRDPNVKRSEDAFVYPIPATDALFVSSNSFITNIWVIKGDCFQEDIDNIEDLSQNLIYEVSELEPNEFTANFSSQTPNFQIDFRDYEKGFYRIFYEIENDVIYWENLYVDPTATNFPDIVFLDNECG